ncbi:PilZ domain-containing protein [Maricaulis sp.]|uniref:PilZ domain-containing protein n=1 Tax=unclassified Maricaulis TaxID=2632371 RepID=UPI001B1050C2|nr:PilZ domain-containing protein [Maricaulis sp.]MBO6796913.1 PilZ domain-containing protein [Maricaulis sp.]
MAEEPNRLDRRKIRIAARGAAERRRHARLPLRLHGRFWSETLGEHACRLIDISPGGARVMSRALPASNQRIILMINGIGRMEGVVVRSDGDEFSLRFSATDRKRDKLADTITWRFNKDRLGLDEDRQAPRKPGRGRAKIRFADGVVIHANVLDVSVTGAAFECLERPKVNEPVRVGEMSGRVARILDNGFAVVFDPPEALRDGGQAA